jgi:putative lipoic acid-binding regulatory protein
MGLGSARKLFLTAVLAKHRCSRARLAQADTRGNLGAIRYDLLYHGLMKEKESLLEFPCDFPIKAIGRTDSGFEAMALGIVRHHVPEFETEDMRSAVSRNGNYLSVTFTVRVNSRQQLDDLYRGLTACKAVLMVI